jgi:hypothetical protein
MPSDECLTIKSTMINHEYKTIHTTLQNISHLICSDFLTNTNKNTGSLSCAEQTVDIETLQPLI